MPRSSRPHHAAKPPSSRYYDAKTQSRQHRMAFLLGLLATLVAAGIILGVAWGIHRSLSADAEGKEPSYQPTAMGPGDQANNQGKSGDKTAAPGASDDATGQNGSAANRRNAQTARACDGVALASPAQDRMNATQLRAALEGVGRQTGATISAAWFDAASGQIQTAGSNAAWVAWSTSKVPVSVAVSQAGKADAMAGSMSAALRRSDNGAAEALWQAVGSNDANRAQTVTGVIRQTGDSSTTVPSTRLRSGFTIFGQTPWTTAAQVGFMMKLPCLKGSAPVISNMSQVDSGQRWGLGSLPGATFKGGWGPGVSGGYLVRQLGWYTNAAGARVPVAIAAQAGSFDGGIGILNQMVKVFR